MKCKYIKGTYHITTRDNKTFSLILNSQEAKFFYEKGIFLKPLNLQEIRLHDYFCPCENTEPSKVEIPAIEMADLPF